MLFLVAKEACLFVNIAQKCHLLVRCSCFSFGLMVASCFCIAILCHCQFFFGQFFMLWESTCILLSLVFFFLFVSSDRSSYGGPRASLRRQLDHKDVYGYQCFYKKPPTGSITLQQFEAYAIERLKGQTTMIVIYWQLHFSQSTKSIYFFLFICDIHYKELMCGLSYASLWTYLHCISNKVIKLHFPECLTFLVVMWWCWWVITVKKWNILQVNRQIETVQWNFIGMGLCRLKYLCIFMFVHRFLFCLCSPEIYWAK